MNVMGKKQPVLRKKDERYEIYDLHLEDFTLSTTYLNRGKSTVGHSHDWEEAYYIIKGRGQILMDEVMRKIKVGGIIVVPRNAFHRVYNDECPKLVFLCIFKKGEGI